MKGVSNERTRGCGDLVDTYLYVKYDVFFILIDFTDGFTWTLDLQPPTDVVPDTAWAKVSLSGKCRSYCFSKSFCRIFSLDHQIVKVK